MNRAPAIGFTIALVVAGAIVALVLAGGGDGRTYTARFANARGLVPGTDVRVAGAPVGSVKEMRVAADGAAEVEFTVDEEAAAPRADATAAIRPVDLLGDNYLSLSPGRAAAPLRADIPVARTSNSPRLDQLLSAFKPNVRNGLKALLVESGLALDRRGADLSGAAVALRPALTAADGVVRQLDAQNRALARVVSSAGRAAGQVGSRSADIGPLLDGLARTLEATERSRPALGTSLEGMPAMLASLRSTSTALAHTASAATPLAADLRDTAPALRTSLDGLSPLLLRVRTASTDLRPTLRAATSLLTHGAPTISGLDDGVRRLRAATPQAAALVDALVPVAPKIAAGFFVNFPDQAAEPGRQPLDPAADPRRAYWRGAAVMSCEVFGIKVKPGCLSEFLASTAGKQSAGKSAGARKPAAPVAKKPVADATAGVSKLLDDILSPKPVQSATNAVKGVLDFLLGR